MTSSLWATPMKISLIGTSFILFLILGTYTNSFYTIESFAQTREQVFLTAILAEPRDRWDILVPDALKILQERHPDIDVDINYTVLPYDNSPE